MPFKLWAPRTRVPASELQAFIQDQVIATFPTASARSQAIPAPKTGQMTWLDIPGVFEYWPPTGEGWLPFGPLRVGTRTDLPAVGRPGMTAQDIAQRHWEWRSVDGVAQWTWPRAAQGAIFNREFSGDTPLANPATGGARLDAFNGRTIYIPAGRVLSVHFTGSVATTAAGMYGFALFVGGNVRRGVVEVGTAGVMHHFTISRHHVPIGPGEFDVYVLGGRFAGPGNWTLIGGGEDQPVEFTIMDNGGR